MLSRFVPGPDKFQVGGGYMWVKMGSRFVPGPERFLGRGVIWGSRWCPDLFWVQIDYRSEGIICGSRVNPGPDRAQVGGG